MRENRLQARYGGDVERLLWHCLLCMYVGVTVCDILTKNTSLMSSNRPLFVVRCVIDCEVEQRKCSLVKPFLT